MYSDPLPNHQVYNIFAMAIWGPTAKFNFCRYFRLYGILYSSINVLVGTEWSCCLHHAEGYFSIVRHVECLVTGMY